MADMKISELSSVASLNNGDLIEVSQVDSSSPTGYTSMKASMADIGEKVVNEIQYTQELDTSAKKITGAINENKSQIGDLSQLTTTDKSSLVGAVNEVNGIVNTITDNDLSIGSLGDAIRVTKRGNMVQITLASLANIPTGAFTTLATLPTGYRPSRQIYEDFRDMSSSSRRLRLRIDTDGKIYIYNYDSAITSPNNTYHTMCFITA